MNGSEPTTVTMRAGPQGRSPSPQGWYKEYKGRAVLGLGITQIVVGMILIILHIITIVDRIGLYIAGHGIWTGVMVILAGVFAILSWRYPSRGYIITSLVMSIIAASLAGISWFFSGSSFSYMYYFSFSYLNVYALVTTGLVVLAIVALIISIIVSAFGCKAVCANRPNAYTQHTNSSTEPDVMRTKPSLGMTVLGCIQFFNGLAIMGFGIGGIAVRSVLSLTGYGIWCGAFVVAHGVVAVIFGRKNRRGLMIAQLVLAILACVMAAAALSLSAGGMSVAELQRRSMEHNQRYGSSGYPQYPGSYPSSYPDNGWNNYPSSGWNNYPSSGWSSSGNSNGWGGSVSGTGYPMPAQSQRDQFGASYPDHFDRAAPMPAVYPGESRPYYLEVPKEQLAMESVIFVFSLCAFCCALWGAILSCSDSMKCCKPNIYKQLPIYSAASAKFSGIGQFVVGSLCWAFSLSAVVVQASHGSNGNGTWCGTMFILSGIFGYMSGVQKRKPWIVAAMVLAIVSSLFVVSMIIHGILGTIMDLSCITYHSPYYAVFDRCEQREAKAAMNIMHIVLGVAQLVFLLWSSILACKSCCCATSSQQVEPAVMNTTVAYSNNPQPVNIQGQANVFFYHNGQLVPMQMAIPNQPPPVMMPHPVTAMPVMSPQQTVLPGQQFTQMTVPMHQPMPQPMHQPMPQYMHTPQPVDVTAPQTLASTEATTPPPAYTEEPTKEPLA